MPLVIVGTLCIGTAATLFAFATLGMRTKTSSAVATNLQRGTVNDLRELTLAQPTSQRTVQPFVAGIGRSARRLTPIGSIEAIDRKLVLAGRPANWPLEAVLAAKVVLSSIGAILTVLVAVQSANARTIAMMVVFSVLLYLTPDVLLTARAAERQREILYALPDSLDQMTICMEAGLGFEAAIVRASRSNTGPLAQELIRTLQEIQVGVGRRQALRNLADRSTVGDLRHFVTAVVQAEHYGVPIADILRNQAADLRAKRRQRAEEAARRLPLKLLFPLILFILPPLFIVLVGPAALSLVDSFPRF
jgi:tight adherence protein C